VNEALKPTITTIIPTYRRPQLLKQAINSVLKQTYPHFQVCVYDNASGDDTASVVAEIARTDPRVKYYCHPENIGAGKNGLEHVETPFFSFLSDDDTILPEFYETALAGFESHPDAMFSVTNVIHVGKKGNIIGVTLDKWTPGIYRPPSGLIATLEYGASAWTGILFRKEVSEKVGLLDLDIWCNDLDFILKIAAHYPFVVSKRHGAVFNEAMSLKVFLFDERWLGWFKMIQHLTEDKSLPDDVRAYAELVLLGMFEKRLFATGVGYLCRGYTVDAKKVAVLLRDQYGRFTKYKALSALINTYRYVPFARLAFRCLIVCYSKLTHQHPRIQPRN
jgi:glycosyltransferase involved in cell wall biosynthesis